MTVPMLPMLPIPSAIRAANAFLGLLLMQGMTMTMWRGLLNTSIPSLDMRASRPRFSMNFHNDRDFDKDRSYYRDRHYREREYDRDRDSYRDRDRDYDPPRHRNKPLPKRYTSRDVEMVQVIPVVHPFSVPYAQKAQNSPQVVIIPASATSSFSIPGVNTVTSSSSTGSSGGKQIIIESIPSHLVTPTPLEAPSTQHTPSLQTPLVSMMRQMISAPSSASSSQQRPQQFSSGTTVMIMASGSSNIPKRQQLSQSHDSLQSLTESPGISRTETDSRQDTDFESTTKDLKIEGSSVSFSTGKDLKDSGLTVLDSNLGKNLLMFNTNGSKQRELIPPPQKLNMTEELLAMTDTIPANPTENNLLVNFIEQAEPSSLNRKQFDPLNASGTNIVTDEKKNTDQTLSYSMEMVAMTPISLDSKAKDNTQTTMSSVVEQKVKIKEKKRESSPTSYESHELSSSLSTEAAPDFL